MAPTLSTTGYAVLGLLAVRPATAYELTQQMQRSLDYCWPTSERSLYDQPERLVARGLAAVSEDDGRRTYHVTGEGRAALRAWLSRPSAMPRFQNEPLLRVLLADQGSVEDLRRVLSDLRSHVAERRRAGVAQLTTYLEGEGLFQERGHIVAIVGDLVSRLLTTIDDWAVEVADAVDGWGGSTDDIGLTPELRHRLEEIVARNSERLEPEAREPAVSRRRRR